MNRQVAPLGALCTLVKGTSPISKTTPGPFTLVTTGEVHKTADHFQLDAEAVCVPLISSTGHGHASLKRVHYQSGKFALANLLAAAVVKDPSALSTRFLAKYLMFSKDRLIVPLMTGSANMSISIERLGSVPIEFPSLEEQERIVMVLDEVAALRQLRARVLSRTGALIPAVFHDMFGDPAHDQRWSTALLGNLGTVVTGNTPPRSEDANFGDFIEWVKTDNIDEERGRILKAAEGLSEEGAKIGRVVPAGTVLITCIAGSKERLGDAAVTDRPVAINQQINAIIPGEQVDGVFLCEMVRELKPAFQQRATGAMTGLSGANELSGL